jgi:hypothetical protein
MILLNLNRKMLRRNLLIVFMVTNCTLWLNAQSNYYFIAEAQSADELSGTLHHQATYTVSFLNGVIQTLYDDIESTEYTYYGKDTVYINYKNRSGKEITGLGTPSEMKFIINKQIDHKRKTLRMESTGNREVIMGLLCNETLISYEYKYLGVVFKLENLVWFNNVKKVDKELMSADISNIWLKNNYTDSLKTLDGFIIKQVLKSEKSIVSSIEVKEFNESDQFDLRPKYFVLKAKKIKKLKSCIREISSFRKSKDSFNRLNNK